MDPRLVPCVQEYCGDVHGIRSLSWQDAPRVADFAAVGVPTLVVRGGSPQHPALDAGRTSRRRSRTRGW
jgi:hypothetical protein